MFQIYIKLNSSLFGYPVSSLYKCLRDLAHYSPYITKMKGLICFSDVLWLLSLETEGKLNEENIVIFSI